MKFSFKSILQSVVIGAMCSSVVLTTAGCTPAQKQTTLQVITSINARLPGIIAAADTVAATIEILDPVSAAQIQVGDQGFDALAHTLQGFTAAYIANPDASTLQKIQGAINTLEQNVNTATLNAAGIKDVESQRLAIAALRGLLTVVTIAFGLITPTESVSMLMDLRGAGEIHLAQVRPYMDEDQLQAAGKSAGVDVDAMFSRAEAFGF